MAVRTFLYAPTGLVAADLTDILPLGAAPVVAAASGLVNVPITIDDAVVDPTDLTEAMARFSYVLVVELLVDPLAASARDYGVLAADPTEPAPSVGDRYFNSGTALLRTWGGATWADVGAVSTMAAERIKGRAVGTGVGPPQDLTPAQAAAVLAVPGAAGQFLDGTGIFSVPAFAGPNVFIATPGATIAAIFAAITTETVIYLPAGTYAAFNNMIPAGVRVIRGDGPATILTYTETISNDRALLSNGDVEIKDIEIQNLVLTATGGLLAMDNDDEMEIINVSFQNPGASIGIPAIKFDGSGTATFRRCVFVLGRNQIFNVTVGASGDNKVNLQGCKVTQMTGGSGSIFELNGGTTREAHCWDSTFILANAGTTSNKLVNTRANAKHWFHNCEVLDYSRLHTGSNQAGFELHMLGCRLRRWVGNGYHINASTSAAQKFTFRGNTFETGAPDTSNILAQAQTGSIFDFDFGITREVTASSDVIENADATVLSNPTAATAVALTLPRITAFGLDELLVIDAKGDAGTYNVTLTRNGAPDVIGSGAATSYVIDTDGGWVRLAPDRVNNVWNVVSVSRTRQTVDTAINVVLTATDLGKVIRLTAGANATLPSPTTVGDGWWVDIKEYAGSALSDVVRAGAESVDGVAADVSLSAWEARTLLTDGTDWGSI